MNSQEIMDNNNGSKKEKNYITPGRIIDYNREKNKFKLKTENAFIIITFLSDNMFRLTATQDNNQEPDMSTTRAVINHDLCFEKFDLSENDNRIIINTGKIVLQISKKPYTLSVFDKNKNIITVDHNPALGWYKKEVSFWKKAREDEKIFGLGEKTGQLDKEGRTYTMWNTDVFEPHVESTDPMYVSIPFYIGFKKNGAYGLYFDNSYRTKFSMKAELNGFYQIKAEGGKIDYYYIYGDDLKEIVTNYTDITGKPYLPPRWSLGYHQSRYSYETEKEVREITDNFREKEIPCDTIHLDIHYMNGYRVFTWDNNRFPQPEKMISDLKEDGFKIVNIIDPGVKRDPEYEVYKQGIKNDYFCKYLRGEIFRGDVWPGESVFPDFSKKEVRDWWRDLHKRFLDQGVKGFWNDMNEPAVFNEKYTIDEEVIHENDGRPDLHKRFHNTYALYEAEATHNAVKKYKNERPFVLSRAGFAGIQRYSAIWTGDNRSFWNHLKLAIPMLLNMGLSGINFAGTDIGGFSDDANGELLTRWTQMGTFMPFFRNHTSINTINQEPWAFGAKYEKIIKKYIKLRYKLLTHFYSLFYQAHRDGLPVMRPMVMEYPEDKNTHNLYTQFMLGSQMIIAPVFEPDQNKKMVYLPEGNWIDFDKDKIISGPSHHICDTPLSNIPVFVREGSIIPLQPVQNFVGEKTFKNLDIHIYTGSNDILNDYLLFEDDSISNDYKKGKYRLSKFKYNKEKNTVKFKQNILQNNFSPSYDNYRLIFHNIKESPQNIKLNGKDFKQWNYNKVDNKITINISINKNFKLKIKIK